jgi:putative hydrolase of the HAD superfamily
VPWSRAIQIHCGEPNVATTDLIICSHEVGLAKPDQRIFQLTCERLGLPPYETIFLDDYEPNITAAREFGMQAILFGDTGKAIAEVRARLQDFVESWFPNPMA